MFCSKQSGDAKKNGCVPNDIFFCMVICHIVIYIGPSAGLQKTGLLHRNCKKTFPVAVHAANVIVTFNVES